MQKFCVMDADTGFKVTADACCGLSAYHGEDASYDFPYSCAHCRTLGWNTNAYKSGWKQWSRLAIARGKKTEEFATHTGALSVCKYGSYISPFKQIEDGIVLFSNFFIAECRLRLRQEDSQPKNTLNMVHALEDFGAHETMFLLISLQSCVNEQNRSSVFAARSGRSATRTAILSYNYVVRVVGDEPGVPKQLLEMCIKSHEPASMELVAQAYGGEAGRGDEEGLPAALAIEDAREVAEGENEGERTLEARCGPC